jgi:hypothetical protein
MSENGYGAGSLVAAALMGWYLWRRHPLLWRELRDVPLGDVPEGPEGG